MIILGIVNEDITHSKCTFYQMRTGVVSMGVIVDCNVIPNQYS